MISRVFLRKMSQTTVNKLLNNAEIAEKRLSELKCKLEDLRKVKIEQKIQELTRENAVLAEQVEKAKAELIRLEVQHGKKQYPIPGKTSVAAAIGAGEPAPNQAPKPVKTETKAETKTSKKESKKPKEPKEEEPDVPEISRLDLRIGKIVDVQKHPDADSLYVEQIDCGDEKPRTIVSGLVNHVPIEEMRDRMVMVLCNLKPVKMRGVTSEGMVMCASSPEKVEVLIPPVMASPGDLVSCLGFPRKPDAVMNPKKKIFETVAPDLKTNDQKVACYKDKPLVVLGKGPVVAPTLKGVHVK